MTTDLKPNPTAAELEAYQKRITALKRKAYDECTPKVHQMCDVIYRHYLASHPQEDWGKRIALDHNDKYTLLVHSDDCDLFIVSGIARDCYNEVTMQAYPHAEGLTGLMDWYAALRNQYAIARKWLDEQEQARISAQYGEILDEADFLFNGELPTPFVPEFKVGDEIASNNKYYRGKTLTITAVDCDSAEYEAWHWDSGYEYSSVQKYVKIRFWQARAAEKDE